MSATTPNQRQVLAVKDSLTGVPFYLKGNSSDGSLAVNGSLTIGGTTDNSAFTAGTSTGTPNFGFYHTTIDTVTDGRAAAVAITSKRAQHINLRNSAGTEIGDATTPVQVSLANTAANGTALLVTGTGGTFPVTGTFWQATQPVSGTVSITANSAINVAQINGITPLMGNGTTGTGSQRVTIASDNTAFSVNATLAAETTKVIGTVRTADGSGNLYTTNSTTYTAKFAQDGNILGTLGTAFSTAGKVDIKGADGDVFVRQATGSNLHTVIDSGTVTTVSTVTAVTAITNALPTGTNTLGTVTVAPLATTIGLTKYRGTAVSNTAIAVKASAGRLYNYHIYNAGSLDSFVQFYDVAQGSVTVGTTVPDITFWVPAGGAIDGAWNYSPVFATAISIAATTTVTGGTAPATALLVNLGYI